MQLLTINEAAQISGKSIQTIRRMIKQKKIQVKRQKTPQGFNYLVIKESLVAYTQPGQTIQENVREHRPIAQASGEMLKEQIDKFSLTIQSLIDQHQKDKENFFQLIKTFQDRVVSLEGHIKLLEAPKKKWFRLW